MNKTLANILTVVLMVMIGVAPLRSVNAEDRREQSYGSDMPHGSMPSEATKAVFGRVFGVADQGGDISYLVVELADHTPTNSAVRSALVPGWGQAFNGQRKKSFLIFGSFFAVTTAAIVLNHKANDSYSEYESNGRRNASTYDDYENQRTAAYVAGGLAAVLWLYGIHDASKNSYKPLVENDPNFKLAFLPHGGEMSWRKKF